MEVHQSTAQHLSLSLLSQSYLGKEEKKARHTRHPLHPRHTRHMSSKPDRSHRSHLKQKKQATEERTQDEYTARTPHFSPSFSCSPTPVPAASLSPSLPGGAGSCLLTSPAPYLYDHECGSSPERKTASEMGKEERRKDPPSNNRHPRKCRQTTEHKRHDTPGREPLRQASRRFRRARQV